MSRIASVFLFPNGMVAVCDERGQQMPEYQGEWNEKGADILRDKPSHVPINGLGDWNDCAYPVLTRH